MTAKRISYLLAIIFLIAFAILLIRALPARADTCTTGSIDWTDSTPVWVPDVESEELNVNIEGHYLWVQAEENRGVEGFDLEQGVVSVELLGFEDTVTVCSDGTVTFQSAPAPNISTAMISVWIDLSFRTMIGPR